MGFIVAILGILLLLSGCSSRPVDFGGNRDSTKPIDINDLERSLGSKSPASSAGRETPASSSEDSVPVATGNNSSAQNTMNQKKQYSEAPAVSIDSAKQYAAVLHTTEGDITIALAAKATPKTVNNFVFLAREGFYDGVIFHRTIKGFMIQGGDPTGTGMGGPGYTFADEPFSGEYKRGTVAMANAGPDTNGSQFFIMHADYALPPNYVIFGQVTDGLDVVDKIATAPTQPGGEGSTPASPVSITGVDVAEK